MDFGDCEVTTTQSAIVLEENKRRLVINNPRKKRVRKVQVDGCAIIEGKRCDHLIIGPDNSEYFVELKGCDIDHAINQLEASIYKLGTKIRSGKRLSIIISSRCPLTTPKIQKLKLHFRKNLMSELILKNTYMEIEL